MLISGIFVILLLRRNYTLNGGGYVSQFFGKHSYRDPKNHLSEKRRNRRKRQIIGVYKRSAAYDIVQLEHLDNQIVAKVPSYLRFLFLLRLRYRTLAHKQLLPGSMLIMQLDHCPLAFPRFGLFSGVSLDALALETAVHTMIDVAAVSSLHMSCRLLTRAPYQP